MISKFLHRNDTTDVLDVLTSQHTEVDALIAQFEAGEGNREEIIGELANQLAAHAAAEEQVFYPAVMAKATASMLHEHVEEHLSIKRLLADLTTRKLDDATITAKMTVLKEYVSHHAHHEEEKKLFVAVRAMFSKEELAAIGNEYLVAFEELMAGSPKAALPDQIAKAAALPATPRA